MSLITLPYSVGTKTAIEGLLRRGSNVIKGIFGDSDTISGGGMEGIIPVDGYILSLLRMSLGHSLTG
jgi:hypothetical protein